MAYDRFRKPRRPLRLKNYDYASGGAYFVTICTQGQVCAFGEAMDDAIRGTPAGKMVRAVWEDLPLRYPNVELDAFVVMPNHFHGVVAIHDSEAPDSSVGAPLVGALPKRAGTRPAPTLGRVIGSFKSLTTRAYMNGIREHGWPPFNRKLWQRNYYEHIVRDESDLNRIREYIVNNPKRWALDRENMARTGTDKTDTYWFPA